MEKIDEWVNYDPKLKRYHIIVGKMNATVSSEWYEDFLEELKNVKIEQDEISN